LEHGADHQRDHETWSRRGFLRSLGIVGTAGMVLNQLPLTAVGGSRLAQALTTGNDDRILVIIRLKGGNDGLNTLIPKFNYGKYAQLRPTLKIDEGALIPLDDYQAMHPQLAGLHTMWLDGRMKVVNNVGYPDQNLSHFRSSDIWASASDSNEYWQSGWLGRMLDRQYPDFLSNPPQDPPAIQIGGTSNLIFGNEDDFNLAMSTNNPQELAQIAESGQLYDIDDVPDCHRGEQISFLRAVANTTFRYAGVIADAYDNGNNSQEYSGDLGDQLALVARLIRGGLGTRLYMVNIDGFDTHANQPDWHPYLLESVANNTAAFFRDLKNSGDEQRTLGMTISEFGRRPEENGSRGTDHGAAAPIFLFGSSLNGNGTLGGQPDLDNLDDAGNMQPTVDFRQLYATVLEDWLCLEPDLVDEVLGDSHERLAGTGIECSIVGTRDPRAPGPAVDLNAYFQGGYLRVDYRLPQAGDVELVLHDIQGRRLHTLFRGYQTAGEQQQRASLFHLRRVSGIYVCTLYAYGRAYSRRIALVH
jgi:uncharacterized protein (DUF1501 family)